MGASVCLIRHREFDELGLRREAEALRDAGYDVHVICLGDTGSGVEQGIHVHRVPLQRERAGVGRYLVDYLGFFVATTVLVTVLHVRHRFAVVQVTTMPDFLVFCTVVPRLLGAKVIAFMKEPTPELGEMRFGPGRWPRLLQIIEQAAIRYADLAITVTEQLKEQYVRRGADASSIRVVLNGPGREQISGSDVGTRDMSESRDFTLICHGAIEERYGHETILRAVAMARRDVPRLRFRITGQGNDERRIRQLIDELDLAANVDFLGWVTLEQLTHELSNADVGVVAQLSSPYSNLVHTNKMYEYIMFGKPVIATRLDAVRAYFGPESLYYVPPGDHERMARAIVELATDPELRRRLTRNASRLYEDYGWARQGRLFVDAYREVLAS
jgi:glycosyltransferase involved in cell wall biosynthesis